MEMSFALVTDATGAPVGSVAVARDATERVERDKAAMSTRLRSGEASVSLEKAKPFHT